MSYDNRQVTNAADEVTPSDTAAEGGYGFYVGGTGDVAVVCDAGNTVVFTAVPAGTIIPLLFTRIKSTGTTATNIVRFF